MGIFWLAKMVSPSLALNKSKLEYVMGHSAVAACEMSEASVLSTE